MIYLILKIFFYMLLALAAGAAAGWLARNIVAMKREEEINTKLAETRSRVPQFESLMRSRDEQIKRMRDDITGRDVQITELSDSLKAKETALREKERDLKKFVAQSEAMSLADDGEHASAPGDSGGLMGGDPLEIGAPTPDPTEIAELRSEVEGLKKALAEARAAEADALAEVAAAQARIAELRAGAGSAQQDAGATGGSDAQAEELAARLKQKAEEYDRLSEMLRSEKRRVTELEGERELQNKSLQVLHQQLELERERNHRAAAG